MRCTIVLLALAAFGAALPQQQQQKQRAADQDLLKKQQDVILLLQQITQPIADQQLQILGTSYDIESNAHQYENPILVKYYVGSVQAGLVQPKGTVYSNSISQLRKEVALLHRILMSAKTYQTFLATAAWARVHVNEEQFVKAFIGAVLQHPETQGVILPPLYEIIPQYYFDARIIQEAQNAAVQGVGTSTPVVIPVNYTATLPHGEQQLSYFTQDVGLANYYAYVNLAGYLQHGQTPIQYQQQGVQSQDDHIGQGSIYYYLHQQLMARHSLNRLSNGLGPVQIPNFVDVHTPYQPHLRYTNGLNFPGRSQQIHNSPVRNHLVNDVEKIYQRLVEAIDTGSALTSQCTFLSIYQPQGLNILGDIIQGTGRSINPRYYGSFQAAARQLLGNAPEVQNIYDYTPSVLELGQTAVRDPAFYQLYKKIIHLFKLYQNSMPAYQYNDVVLPGVTIQNVQITPLVTFFNDYFVDLTSGTTVPQTGEQQQQQVQHQQQQQIQAHLKRLDHKPYEYQITVQSEQTVPGAVVRVYLGAKYDYQGKPISISQHRHQFVELDQFITDLQQGQNVIVRQSQQAPGQSFDYPSVQEIQHTVNGAAHAQEPFYVTEPHQIFGFPARLSLPKGQQQGFPVQLFVVISQPGQQNVPYGPVVPQQYQTYQQNEYQVVGTEEYSQQVQHQSSKVTGLKQTVEVVSENLPVNQQENHAVRNHYANLYTRQHGRYPYTHGQYQVGQGHHVQDGIYGQSYGQVYQGQQGQYEQHGQRRQHVQQVQGQTGQYTQGQYQWTQGIHQGRQGEQGHQGQFHQQFQQYHGQQQVGVAGVQGGVPTGVQDVQGVGTQTHGVQGIHGVYGGNTFGIQGKYQTTYQGQSQSQHGFGTVYTGSGQYHAGGFQNILTPGQRTQDGYVNKYFQNKHISHIIGGAISLDGKPLGYPLDRPLTTGALTVPNVYVQTVYVYHEGEPTNEMSQQ